MQPERLSRRVGLWIEFGVVMLLAWAPSLASHVIYFAVRGHPYAPVPGQGAWDLEYLGTHARLLATVGCAAFLLSLTGELGRLDFRMRLKPDGWFAVGLLAIGVPCAVELMAQFPEDLWNYESISAGGVVTGFIGVLALSLFVSGVFTGYALIRLPELLGGPKRALAASALLGASYASLDPLIFGLSALALLLSGAYFLAVRRLGLVTLAYVFIFSVSFAIELRRFT